MSDGFLSPLASEFLSPYFDMLDALGPGNMNRIAHSEKLVALLAQVQLEARKEALEEGLAIYIKAFEQNWVVQDTIDAIRSLAAASKTKGGNK